MNELQCQQLVIDAVRERGGEGLKASNRFLVGVVDLLIKMPDCTGLPAFWLEAKLEKLAPKTMLTNHAWKLDVTAKQKEFLRKWHEAGMDTGVVSFIQIKGRNINSLHMAVYWYDHCVVNDWTTCVIDHHPLGDSKNRFGSIRAVLESKVP